MVFVLIGIAIGIILVVVLIVKVSKTPSREVMGMDLRCIKCGTKTNGSKCPKCKDTAKSFGI